MEKHQLNWVERWVQWQINKDGSLKNLIWGYVLGIAVCVAIAKIFYYSYILFIVR